MAKEDLGRRIADARTELGLTQVQLAERLRMARSTLAEIETGQRKVAAEELYRISEVLSRPLDYFLSPGKPATIFAYRLKAETIDETARRALVHLDNRLGELRALERFSGVSVRPRLKQYRIDGWKNPEVAGRNVAMMERARLQLGTSPVPSVREVLEQRVGLLAFGDYIPSGDFSGAYASDGERAALLINVAHVRGRTNFTIPHEYGHALVLRDGVHIELRGFVDDDEERFADAFAGNFLMPVEAVEEAIENAQIDLPLISADQVLFLASQFGVSFEAMLGRLSHFGIVERKYARQVRKDAKPMSRARELGLPDPREEFDPLPRTFRRMAFQAFHTERISRSRLAEFLDVDPDEAYGGYLAWAALTLAAPATGEGARGAVA